MDCLLLFNSYLFNGFKCCLKRPKDVAASIDVCCKRNNAIVVLKFYVVAKF